MSFRALSNASANLAVQKLPVQKNEAHETQKLQALFHSEVEANKPENGWKIPKAMLKSRRWKLVESLHPVRFSEQHPQCRLYILLFDATTTDHGAIQIGGIQVAFEDTIVLSGPDQRHGPRIWASSCQLQQLTHFQIGCEFVLSYCHPKH